MKLQSKTNLLTFLLFIPQLLLADQNLADLQKAGVFLDNLPPWELYEAPPRVITQDPPVFLDTDSEGNVSTLNITKTKSGTYEVTNRILSASELVNLGMDQTIVFRENDSSNLPSSSLEQTQMALGSTSCPLPASLTIAGTATNVEATGGITVSNTSRPVGATTQWLVFDFWTNQYRGRGSHMPMALFHAPILHGWGAFIGDNHGASNGCGSSSRFNSQIEGWIQTVEPPTPQITEDWQSYTFANSCGNEMVDGTVVLLEGGNVPRYRFEMQTSTGHWVSYRILQRFNGSATWHTLTDWTTLDVDTGNWAIQPLNWLTGTEGILIGATKATLGTGSWSIKMYNVDCGWF